MSGRRPSAVDTDIRVTADPAYPVWSTVVIAVDVIVIYAIVVHGRELKSQADGRPSGPWPVVGHRGGRSADPTRRMDTGTMRTACSAT
jgi:hypothetical protein